MASTVGLPRWPEPLRTRNPMHRWTYAPWHPLGSINTHGWLELPEHGYDVVTSRKRGTVHLNPDLGVMVCDVAYASLRTVCTDLVATTTSGAV